MPSARAHGHTLPRIVASGGESAAKRFIEFFAVTIRNPNTREAYARNVGAFLAWCETRGVRSLDAIQPMAVAAYIEALTATHAKPTVKQHLAAIRKLFDWLVTGHVVPVNPAASVAGPRHVVNKGKTHVLTAEEARLLIDSIPRTSIAGLRDRALISIMVYAFARVSAACGMTVGDVYVEGRRTRFRLHEKGGKEHTVVAHHSAEEAVYDYLEALGAKVDQNAPLFRTIDRHGLMTLRAMTRNDAFRMIKRRARAAGLSARSCCHTFRATGITEYMRNGGTIEKAAAIAAHSSTRTTQLYNRTNDDVTLDEIERIRI